MNSPAFALLFTFLAIGNVLLLEGAGLAKDSITDSAVSKIDLFWQGKGDVHTYRIPGIVVTAKGTVLAYCEARKLSAADRGEIEIHLRRSTDGGKSWSEPVQIAHIGERLPRNPYMPDVKLDKDLGGPEEQTVNNPMAIADRDGTVHFVYCVEYRHAFYMRSDDDGLTWSEPVDITAVIKDFRPAVNWQSFATGPGHGIQLLNGRLIVPIWLADYRKDATVRRAASVIFSDDGGQSWQAGELAISGGTESAVAERPDGSVLISTRNSSQRRALSVSPDGVSNWSETRFADELLEAGCMAGLVRHPGDALEAEPLLLFSNPHTTQRPNRYRRNVSIKLSRDGGETWPVHRVLEPGPSAYSDLAVLPDGTVLCFYESGDPDVVRRGRDWAYARLRLARFSLDWLRVGDEEAP
jgi:sialidase-1